MTKTFKKKGFTLPRNVTTKSGFKLPRNVTTKSGFKLPRNVTTKGGFTLIELLIVIGIIAILAAAVIIAVNPGEKLASARDATRERHVQSLIQALYVYQIDEGSFPLEVESAITNDPKEICNTNLESPTCTDMVNLSGLDIPIPVDPQAEGDGTGYTVVLIVSSPTTIGVHSQNSETGLIRAGHWNITDERDNQTYSTVIIGDQWWMAENMNYDDGCTEVIWENNVDKGWCGYYIDNGVELTEYGLLYQWSAAMDGSEVEGAQGICPDGWSVPTDAELHTLEDYLATDTCDGTRPSSWDCDPAGAKMAKEDALWDPGTQQSHNNVGESGFDALPGGYRHADGTFAHESTRAYFWSSSDDGASAGQAWHRNLYYDYSTVLRSDSDKERGFSVRCLRDL